MPDGQVFQKQCEFGRRCRINFETDVENGYFERAADRGTFTLEIVRSSHPVGPLSYSCPLDNGIAHLSLALPGDAEVGVELELKTTVDDPTLTKPFVNLLKVRVTPYHEHPTGASKPKPPRTGAGTGDDTSEQGITLPNIKLVHENDKFWTKYKFSADTACHVISDPSDDGKLEHSFYINADNTALKTEMKYGKQNPKMLEAKFKYGNVLLGLAMLHDDEKATKHGQRRDDTDEDDRPKREPVQDTIRRVSQAMAPIMLPMIDQLSGLDEELLEEISSKGEDA